MFSVDPKTVSRWAKAGIVNSIRTPGGHRRFRTSEMLALRDGVAEKSGPDSRDRRDACEPLAGGDRRVGDRRLDGDRRRGDRRAP